jgi:hypothetical protein
MPERFLQLITQTAESCKVEPRVAVASIEKFVTFRS